MSKDRHTSPDDRDISGEQRAGTDPPRNQDHLQSGHNEEPSPGTESLMYGRKPRGQERDLHTAGLQARGESTDFSTVGLGPRLIRMENNKMQTLPCTGCKISSSWITISRVKSQTTTYRNAIRRGSLRQQGGKAFPAPVLQAWGASDSPGGPVRSRMLGPTLGFLIYQVWNLHF